METEKINQSQATPLAPPSAYIRSDMESSQISAQQALQKKKRRNRLLCLTTFVVVIAIALLIYVIVATRYRTPKFRIRAASFTTFQVGNSTDPTFSFVMNTQFTIRNRNFARYKYDSGTVLFEYRGSALGQAYIDDDRVRARTTKKVNETVVMSSGSLVGENAVFDQLGNDIGAGVLTLRSFSELEGKVQVLRIFEKKKYARLNCTMDIQINTKSIQNLICQ